MGRHGNARVKSPSSVLKSEILFLALVWKQDLAAVFLVVPKPFCRFFSALSIRKLLTYQRAGRNAQILAFS